MEPVKIRLTKGITHHRADYECAAWSQDSLSDTGEFALTFVPDPARYHAGHYEVRLPATVTRDYFPAMFAGVASGRYDTKKNAGRRIEFVQRYEVDAFVTDPAIVVTRENIDSLCEVAITELTHEFDSNRKWVMRELTATETPPLNRGSLHSALTFLNRTLERVAFVKTFREWHRNTWKCHDEGRGFDYRWHGYGEGGDK